VEALHDAAREFSTARAIQDDVTSLVLKVTA